MSCESPSIPSVQFIHGFLCRLTFTTLRKKWHFVLLFWLQHAQLRNVLRHVYPKLDMGMFWEQQIWTLQEHTFLVNHSKEQENLCVISCGYNLLYKSVLNALYIFLCKCPNWHFSNPQAHPYTLKSKCNWKPNLFSVLHHFPTKCRISSYSSNKLDTKKVITHTHKHVSSHIHPYFTGHSHLWICVWLTEMNSVT